MKLKIISLAVASALLGAAAVPAQAAESEQAIPSWIYNIKPDGDFRFRYENITNNPGGVNHDRLRIRARVGFTAKVNDDVKLGFRFASGGVTDGTSTNQTLGNGFSDKNFDLDRAYLDWAPSSMGGDSHFVFGKMPQQWQAVTHMVWDDDLNPEGVAYKGKYDLGGLTLIPSAGYYVLGDQLNYVDSNHDKNYVKNDSVSADWHVTWAQVATQIAGVNLGVSYYGYDGTNEGDSDKVANSKKLYSPTIYQAFASYKFNVGLPLQVYGTYAYNDMDNKEKLATYGTKDKSDAYAVGIKTKFNKFKIGYEYRDNGESAINYNFNDSDFGDQNKGSIVKAGYSIAKNMDLGLAYMYKESNVDKPKQQLLQLDLKAKF